SFISPLLLLLLTSPSLIKCSLLCKQLIPNALIFSTLSLSVTFLLRSTLLVFLGNLIPDSLFFLSLLSSTICIAFLSAFSSGSAAKPKATKLRIVERNLDLPFPAGQISKLLLKLIQRAMNRREPIAPRLWNERLQN